MRKIALLLFGSAMNVMFMYSYSKNIKGLDVHVDVRIDENQFLNKTMSDVQKCFADPVKCEEVVFEDGWIWFAHEKRCFVGKDVVREIHFLNDEKITIAWLKFLGDDWHVIYDVTIPKYVSF